MTGTYDQQRHTDVAQEIKRIRVEYQRRASSAELSGRYSLFNEAALLQSHSLERRLLALLKRHAFNDLGDKKILDIGCGMGMQLQRFTAYGAKPGNLSGIDLLNERIEMARSLNPAIDWRAGSAHQLPYPDASFDLVTLFVVFSSILNDELCEKIAGEVWRVLKPGGLILCYDFAYSNPRNPAVRGFSRRRILQLFNRPGASYTFRRLTLAPPIARIIAPRAYWLANMLEQLKFLNTHLLCVISLD
ncbi:MAG TPA: methyltransferase domain-containing protein [Ktedonobacteraceae bacterium]|jgi:ubiquinone/menaquinone biosynthesis C-methylase UbiE|nr:methyltransferase domain-containing protein [Ktedonobacteraceae bacterium]